MEKEISCIYYESEELGRVALQEVFRRFDNRLGKGSLHEFGINYYFCGVMRCLPLSLPAEKPLLIILAATTAFLEKEKDFVEDLITQNCEVLIIISADEENKDYRGSVRFPLDEEPIGRELRFSSFLKLL